MKRKLFNDDWFFSEGYGGSLGKVLGMDGETTAPIPVILPHDAVIGTERTNRPEGSCMGFYEGKNVNYSKEFFMPKGEVEEVVWIEFEGVYQNGFVYVNGSFAGKCTYGYGNYYIDITRFVRFGEMNRISVVVINGMVSGRWYTGGGLYRNVNLITGSLLHVKCEGTRVSACDIEEEQAVLRIVTPIEYLGYKTKNCLVQNEVFDQEGKLIAVHKAPVTMFDHEAKDMEQRVVVPRPILWDVDCPYLYSCHTTLLSDGEIADESESTFGIRKLQLDTTHGLRLNGKIVKLRGGCIHHDHGIIGSAAFAYAEERRIRKLKEAGYNAVRCAHNPAGKSLLEACDRIGMLVMDEFTDVWTTTKVDFDYGFHFSTNWEQDVENMVYKDYNHPCVILYSIGNEISETGDSFDVSWGKKIADKIRSMDPGRYTVNSVNMLVSLMGHMDEILSETGLMDEDCPREVNSMMAKLGENLPKVLEHPFAASMLEEAFNQVDIAGYNYAAYRYEADSRLFPNRIMVGSETMPPDLAKNWKIVMDNPRVIGDFSWTAWEYLGEVGCGKVSYEENPAESFYSKWPWRMAYCGDFDLTGERRPISYWREIVWGLRKQPYISVRPPRYFGQTPMSSQWSWISDSISSWDWNGYENKPITVEVFSDSEEVELFVNRKSVGKKKTGEEKECCAIFDTIYEKGEIKAVADNGEMFLLKSAEDESELVLHVEHETLKAGGQDIAYIGIFACDKKGVRNASSRKRVKVKAEGAGMLLGLGNSDPLALGNYWEDEWELFEGHALAVIRSGMEKGSIKVTVSAEGCKTQTTVIDVVD